jgi:hypothetical protein
MSQRWDFLLALLLLLLCPLMPCRVSEKGTLQLNIDTDSVRRLLLEFPKAARPLDDPSEFASYAHHVEREMGGAINLVKVLQVGRAGVVALCLVRPFPGIALVKSLVGSALFPAVICQPL